EPARSTSGEAAARASASRSASVSASAATMPAASAAPSMGSPPPRTRSSGRGRTGRAVPRRRIAATSEGPRGNARAPPTAGVGRGGGGVGGGAVDAQQPADDGAALGRERRADEGDGAPARVLQGVDLVADGPAERGVDLLEQDAAAEPLSEAPGGGGDPAAG